MAMRWSRAAGLALLATVLGVGCAQGSGTHTHAEPPPVSVLGAVEVPEPTVPAAPVDPAPLAATVDSAPPPPAELPLAPRPAEAQPADVRAESLSHIAYPWAEHLPGWEIEFLAARPGLRGLTFPHEQRIEIYVRPGDTASSLARVLAHEIGHALDVEKNDFAARERWRAARGVDATVPWWPDASRSDFATLAGDFAEAFAVWQTGAVSQSTVAGPPTAEQLALLASMVG